MTFKSPRFAGNSRLHSAKRNSPPLRPGERGEAVAILQQALIDLAYPMPISTAYGSRRADGIYGSETQRSVQAFQGDSGLQRDGIAGQATLGRLDEIFASGSEVSYVAAIWRFIDAGERVLRSPGARKLIGPEYQAALATLISELKFALARHGLASSLAPTFTAAASIRIEPSNKEKDASFAPPIPAPLLLLLALIAAAAAMMGIVTLNQLPRPRLPDFRRPPPKLVELVSKAAAIAAAIHLLMVTRVTALVGQCKNEHPERLNDCAALLATLEQITAEYRKVLVTMKSVRHFPEAKSKADKLQEKYIKALDAAIDCLGCTNFDISPI